MFSTTESETQRPPAPSRGPRRRLRRTVRVVAAVLGASCSLAVVWSVASWRYGAVDARKARTTTSGPYRADLASLDTHPVPAWFAGAVRARGMRFGSYYSGGVDWTFQHQVVKTLGEYSYLPYGGGYADYAEAQVRELARQPPRRSRS
jgi:hypothetical protein